MGFEQEMDQILVMYRVSADAFSISPGNPNRLWMDNTPGRFAYRCLPMTIANSSGWEIVCPIAFEATWDGGDSKESLTIRLLDDAIDLDQISSHFGSGILTFRIGYVFHTAPGWGTWVKGVPNQVVDGIQPLEGLIETDWLPFTFTMNWKFTRSGTVRFERDTPIAFFFVLPYGYAETLQPVIRDISSNPEWEAGFTQWSEQRRTFNSALASADPAAVRKGWQRHYFKGQNIDGGQASDSHVSRRRLKRVLEADGRISFPPLSSRGDAMPVSRTSDGYNRSAWCSGDYRYALGEVRINADPVQESEPRRGV